MSETPFEPYRPEPGRPDDGPRTSSAPPPPPPPAASPYSPYGAGYGYGPVQRHPQATTILVLGIVSIFCSVLGPVAWVMGNRAQEEIRASGGRLGGLSEVSTGRTIGIVMSCVLIAGLVAMVFVLMLAIGILGATS